LEVFARELGPGILIGYVLGALAYIACFVIAFKMRPADEWWLNILLCLFGGIVGWSVGVLLSPMTTAEERTFTGYGKAVSAFAGGFVVAKLDVLMKSVSPALHMDAVVLIARLLLFGTSFCAGFQFTFIARWKNQPLTTTPTPKRFPA
jgi:hypothetical protein